jgi:hypothetical protein
MVILPIDDLNGPIYSASLQPWRLLGRSRPPHLRVDASALRQYASSRNDPGRHGY